MKNLNYKLVKFKLFTCNIYNKIDFNIKIKKMNNLNEYKYC